MEGDAIMIVNLDETYTFRRLHCWICDQAVYGCVRCGVEFYIPLDHLCMDVMTDSNDSGFVDDPDYYDTLHECIIFEVQ